MSPPSNVNASVGCKPITIVYARGSGQPLNDSLEYKEFLTILDKIPDSKNAVTVYELGVKSMMEISTRRSQ